MASPSGQALKQRRQDLLLGAAGPGSLEASAEGKALLESRELRLGRGLEFKDAVWAIARVREASPREVAALVDSLVDAMATSSDSLSLRAAFFLACSLLGGGGGGGGTAGSTAQRLELLAAMSTSGYQHCLAQDRRTALRSYRLLRSAALGAAASLDTAGKRKEKGDAAATTLSLVQDVISIPLAAHGPCAGAGEETISVLMQRAFEPALASLRLAAVSVFGSCIAASQPKVAVQIMHAISSRWGQPSGEKAQQDAGAVVASNLMLQCAGVSRGGAALCSVFLGSMLASAFDSSLPSMAVRNTLDTVAVCAEAGVCTAHDAMSVMLAVSRGRTTSRSFDATTRAMSVRLAGALASGASGEEQKGRFLDQMTQIIECRLWHAETKTVRLQVLKSVEKVASTLISSERFPSSSTKRLARQVHGLLPEVLTYEPADVQQFMVAAARVLAALPTEFVDISSLLVCFLPLQHLEVQSDASNQLLSIAAACLTSDTVISRRNWQELAASCVSERKALCSFVSCLRKLHPEEVDEAVAARAMRHFLCYAKETRAAAKQSQQRDSLATCMPYDNLHELQLLAVCAETFVETTGKQLDLLCRHLWESAAVSDPASTACILQILQAAVQKCPDRRSQVMEIFNDDAVLSTFVSGGLHIELLDIVYTTHNRRKNGLGLLSLMVEQAEWKQVPLHHVLELLGSLALYHCDRVKHTIEKAAADYRTLMDTEELQSMEGQDQDDDDDEFNYMRREEQRREEVEAIEEGVSAVCQTGGPLHRFLPMITGIIQQQLSAKASSHAVDVQTSAVIALGKFMLCSRQLAEDHINAITELLARSHHAQVKHAALSVLADMTMSIPNHVALHREDGQSVLTELLDDDVLGRAALHQLLRLCSIRVIHATGHLGSLAAGMQSDCNVPSITAFMQNYLRTNAKRGGSTKARIIYKTFCDLPDRLAAEDKQKVMLRLISSFCDGPAEKELTTLLAKRLIEHVDTTAASLLYERRAAAVHTVSGLVTQIEQRNLAALVVRVSVVQDESLPDLDRSDLRNALHVTQSLRSLLSLPAAQKAMAADSSISDRSSALDAATKHLSHVVDQIVAALHLDIDHEGADASDESSANISESNDSDGKNDNCSVLAGEGRSVDSETEIRNCPQQTRSSAAATVSLVQAHNRSPSSGPTAAIDQCLQIRHDDESGDAPVDNDSESPSLPATTMSGSELYRKVQNVVSSAGDSSSLTKKGVRLLLAEDLSTEFVKANKKAINMMVVDLMKQRMASTVPVTESLDSVGEAAMSPSVANLTAGPSPAVDTQQQIEGATIDCGSGGLDTSAASQGFSPNKTSSQGSMSASPTGLVATPGETGWAGMEEEEEREENVDEEEDLLVNAHDPIGSGCTNPRMCEFLEAAVAVAGGSAVKRSADAISRGVGQQPGCQTQTNASDETDGPVTKRQMRTTTKPDGDKKDGSSTDGSLSLGSALDDI